MIPVLLVLLTWFAGSPFAEPASGDNQSAARELLAVPQPDLSATEAPVQDILRSARLSLDKMLHTGDSSDRELARAFGEMGELYHSHHVYIPAEPCYRNAAKLAPKEFRWPYYLGYLMVQTSQLDKAAEGFTSALRIRPEYAPAKLRLAGVFLELDRPDEAAPLYQALRDTKGLRAAALFGAGRAALRRSDPQAAVPLLEQALRIQPQASKIHYSLGMAYRALGNITSAQQHLGQYSEGKPQIDDPILDKLNALSRGVRTLFFRAIAAVHAGHHEEAVEVFQQALDQEPENTNARVSLARSLYLTGRPEKAREQLQQALNREPTHALANFFTGVLLSTTGETQAANEYFTATLQAEPEHSGAHHFLGDTSMRAHDYSNAARHYAQVAQTVPQNMPARRTLALAMLRAGKSHGEVKNKLIHTLEAFPEEAQIKLLLARLLAASPDDQVRDSEKALVLAQALFDQANLLENAETLAMAYAETGRFEDAAALQQNALDAALAARQFVALARLEKNLKLYRAAKPCREPFSDHDPMFQPIPIDPRAVFREYPTTAAY